MSVSSPSLWLAFLAGLASFLSPCVFALVPVYVGYLGGRSAAAPQNRNSADMWVSFRHGLAFVLGFSVIFILLGLFSAALGQFLYSFSRLLAEIGGVVVILFGLHLSGLLHIRWLDYDLRPRAQLDRRRGYLSSALMGVFFSAGWVPCVGPVLGAILTLSMNNGSITQGGLLLTAYSAGLAIPFLLAATQVAWVTNIVRRYGKLSLYVQRATGVVVILLGILLLSGRFSTVASLGFFFQTFEEGRVGLLLFSGFVLALLLGLVPAWWAKRHGASFAQSWFVGSGVSFVVLTILYGLGLFLFLS
jgi:cytochrome c-type biogenesis protein